MKQLYLRQPGDLTLREVPVPQAGPGEVVVRVRAALTCGTDLKFFRRGHPKFPLPTAFGHEFSGDITELGEGVEGLAVGLPVMLAPTAPCGKCFECKRGLHNLCPHCMEGLLLGAFSEFVRVPAHIVATNLYPKPEELDYFRAAIMEPLACVVYGHQQMKVKGRQVVVIGAGPIGLLHLALARYHQASRVIMLGRRERRLEAAKAMGADQVVDVADDQSVTPIIQRLTDGKGADVVIECTGRPEVWEESLAATAAGGTTMLFGGCAAGSTVDFPVEDIIDRGLTVKGVFHFTPEAVSQARQLLLDDSLPVDDLITEIRPMSDYAAIFSDLGEGRAIKYGIRPEL